jgi:GNAT superfamily N-acetyltransferase
VTFRRATLADLASLLAMQREFYAHEQYPFDEAVAAEAMGALIEDVSLGRMMIAEDAGYLVVTFGYSLEFGGRDAFVDELYVLPSARGRGLGTEALALAEELCRDAGVRALHLEVEFENSEAKRLYARSGYYEHTRHLMTKKF